MKTFILSILLICSMLQAQTNLNKTSENQLDYFNSNLNELFDDNGNTINNTLESDSLILTGDTINDYYGFSVASAGDVNGDGYDDIIVGANQFNKRTGRAYIYFGGMNIDNVADVIMDGDTLNDKFGFSVSSAGDVNGDGYDDVIVGARNSSSFYGKAFIYFGGNIMDNIADVVMTGESYGNSLGQSVSTAGDVNGDGYDDVIVGEYGFNNYRGRALIYFGGVSMNNVADVIMNGEIVGDYFGVSVSKAGDVNNDGFDDVIVGASFYNNRTGRAYIYLGGFVMNNVADVIMTGEDVQNFYGSSVASARDVNGDGYDDVIVGARNFNNNLGRAYIYYGGALINNTPDIIMNGENFGDFFGNSVASAGDVNGDGYDDIIVGAFQYMNSVGRAYIYYGGNSMNNIEDIIKTGDSSGYQFGNSVSSAGDINGNGHDDIIVGASMYNSFTGRAIIYYNLLPAPYLLNPNNNSINNLTYINFKWNKINSSIYYQLIISSDSNFNNIIVNDSINNDTSKTIIGFIKNKKYFWRVKSYDSSGVINSSQIWNFKIIPPIFLNLKILFEGMYSTDFNLLRRKDTVNIFLRNSSPPYELVDSATGTIDSNSFSNIFNIYNASSGTYYIEVKHFNSIATWSKSGGEILSDNGSIYNYDFTNSISQAYGDNLKIKGSKYCLYSGDVNQDGYIDLLDVVPIYNDATLFTAGNYLSTDLTADGIVDLTDLTICNNNSSNFVRVRRP
jgi:hypothetical protein